MIREDGTEYKTLARHVRETNEAVIAQFLKQDGMDD
jgi:hypothetical protein